MNEREVKISDTKMFRKNEVSIRAAQTDDGTMFSVRDILTVCGIQAPDKWMTRNRNDETNFIRTEKLAYPILCNAGGYRKVKMLFVNKENGLKLLGRVWCGEETKKWLMDAVFRQTSEPEVENPEAIPEPLPKQLIDSDALNRRIDKIMMELFEIKKMAYVHELKQA